MVIDNAAQRGSRGAIGRPRKTLSINPRPGLMRKPSHAPSGNAMKPCGEQFSVLDRDVGVDEKGKIAHVLDMTESKHDAEDVFAWL